jgi:hypothetical protein
MTSTLLVVGGYLHQLPRIDERKQLCNHLSCGRHQFTGGRMVVLHGFPHRGGPALGVDASGGIPELRLLAREFALPDGQQLAGRQLDELLSAVTRLQVRRADCDAAGSLW